MKHLWLLLIFCPSTWALENKSIPQVGPHFPILTFEKNENPQNIMIVYTKLDESCHFKVDSKNSKKPELGFYWLMDHQRYKPVHRLIQSGIRRRLQLNDFNSSSTQFSVELNDLKELNAEIKNAQMNVTAVKSKSGCDVDVLYKGDGQERPFRLVSIYSDSSKTFWPPFRKLKAVTINGLDLSTGEKVSRTFSVKR